MQKQSKLEHYRQITKSIAIFLILGSLTAISGCTNTDNKTGSLPSPLPTAELGSLPSPSPTGQPGGRGEPDTEEETLTELPLPKNGYGKFFFKKSKTSSRLKFVPHTGTQEHMIVKLEDWDSGRVICWFFVKEGQTVETPIPEGSYRFKIATGEKWYGEEHLFGREATYSSISNNVKIPARTIYTLNLTPSVEGTLQDKKIKASEF